MTPPKHGAKSRLYCQKHTAKATTLHAQHQRPAHPAKHSRRQQQ